MLTTLRTISYFALGQVFRPLSNENIYRAANELLRQGLYEQSSSKLILVKDKCIL